MTIDQLPDEQLATAGWNIRETQDGHKRQIDVCEQQLQAIRQEFGRRAQLRQDKARTEANEKKTQQDAMVNEIVAKLAERNGTLATAGPKEDKKAAE